MVREEEGKQSTGEAEEIEMDLNASLLEIMVERTLILEELMTKTLPPEEALQKLQELGARAAALLAPKRRRHRAAGS
ncbi:MAG: hypothetical protein GXO09_00175 [Crenarchaeota archaeon]|nr:hypothetical protein [Thermoproteota archaeon]